MLSTGERRRANTLLLGRAILTHFPGRYSAAPTSVARSAGPPVREDASKRCGFRAAGGAPLAGAAQLQLVNLVIRPLRKGGVPFPVGGEYSKFLMGAGPRRMQRRGNIMIVLLVGLAVAGAVSCESVQIRRAMGNGNKLYNAQRYEEAVAEYSKIVALDPDNWDGNYQIAMSYLAMYHPGSAHIKDKEYGDKAIVALERCLAIQPPSTEALDKARGYYLSLLLSADRIDKAVAYMEDQVAKSPRDMALLAQLAELYHRKGDHEKALATYRKRTELEPANKEAWYALGVACWSRSYHGGVQVSTEEREAVLAEGMKALEKALAIDPQYVEALSYLSLLYREKTEMLVALGKNAEAGEAYARAEELKNQAVRLKSERQPG